MVKTIKSVLFPSLFLLAAAQAQAGTDLFEAVRNNNLEALRTAVAENANLEPRSSRGVTPLMHAAAFGSPQAVKILIDAGADVNAKDGFGATALVWAAGDAAKAKMLVEHGADVNARTTNGRTPLIVAAIHDGNAATVRRLLDQGADIKTADEQGETALLVAAHADAFDTVKLLLERGADPNETDKAGFTPLLNASAHGNTDMMRLLIEKGAKVNVANTFGGAVKFGEIALKQLTPLMLAAPHGGPAAVRLLLAAGAEVNARDSRGMTPLMFAVASEDENIEIIRMLVAKGADVNARSESGETALDWARKYGNPRVIATLEKVGADVASPVAQLPSPAGSGIDVRQAIERSEHLLQTVGAEFFRQSGCVGCHHQPSVQMATAATRSAGVRVDEGLATESLKQVIAFWDAFQPTLLERLDGPAAPDIQMIAAFGLAAERQPASLVTDTLAVNIAAKQQRDGGWTLGGFSRPPMEDSDITRTAISLRPLQVYGPPGRKGEFEERIAKARKFLEKTSARTTDEHVWRLVGLYWSGSDTAKLKQAADALRKLQRPDGGWAPNIYLGSDAFATSTAMWALYTAGALAADDEPYQRGVSYLLATQFEDGSWYVRSRAPKFQPYFESGFPFGHDQWISSAATAWATVALAPAATLTVSKAAGEPAPPLRVAVDRGRE
jgi:ankyrin repeat protein